MQLNIALSEAQQKAMLYKYGTIEGYVQNIAMREANKIMDKIVEASTNGIISMTALDTKEQEKIDSVLGLRIVSDAKGLPQDIKELLVLKSIIPTIPMEERDEGTQGAANSERWWHSQGER